MINNKNLVDRLIKDYRFWLVFLSWCAGAAAATVIGSIVLYLAIIPLVFAVLWRIIPQKRRTVS